MAVDERWTWLRWAQPEASQTQGPFTPSLNQFELAEAGGSEIERRLMVAPKTLCVPLWLNEHFWSFDVSYVVLCRTSSQSHSFGSATEFGAQQQMYAP